MKTRHSAEQIVSKLRQADVDPGKRLKGPEVFKHEGLAANLFLGQFVSIPV